MKKVLKILLIGIIVITVINFLNKEDKDFIESCTSQGYSKDYCERVR